MSSFFGTILKPLEWAVAWIMVHVHAGLTHLGMGATSGWTWALSIVGLVVVIRIVLIPLFVKQIKASRGMTLLQPEMKAIQQKYKGKTDQASRQAQSREQMELYRRHGTNPFASCLPLLLQTPVFFALFRVLNDGIRLGHAVGPLTTHLAHQAQASTLLGVPLTATFLGSSSGAAKALTIGLIVLMSATTFTTQRQLMQKNMPASALDNPFAQQQKLIMYVYPVIFAVTGVNFPMGVLLYWLTTNLWTGAQQFYVIRRMPAPGSPAEAALRERRARRTGRRPGRASETRGEVPGGATGPSSASAPGPSAPGSSAPGPSAPRSGTAGSSPTGAGGRPPARGGQRAQPTRKGRPRPAGSQPPARSGASAVPVQGTGPEPSTRRGARASD